MQITLEYFPIQGRLEPIKYILEDAGLAYTEEKDLSHFQANKMDCNKYLFNQLPRVTVDGEILAQQDAILRYFAAIIGQGPSADLKQNARSDMLGCSVEDLARAYTNAIYSPEHATLLVTLANEGATKVFGQYESLLKSSSSKTGHFVYDYPCFAEYHLFAIVRSISVIKPAILAGFPLLSAWYSSMAGRKGIKAYLESGRQIEKINNHASGQLPLC